MKLLIIEKDNDCIIKVLDDGNTVEEIKIKRFSAFTKKFHVNELRKKYKIDNYSENSEHFSVSNAAALIKGN